MKLSSLNFMFFTSLRRDAVTKTTTVSDLIQSLDAQGVISHLTFLLSAFLVPAADAALASSIDYKKVGADNKNKGNMQEHKAASSASAQVIH
jgi:hypothetical protein